MKKKALTVLLSLMITGVAHSALSKWVPMFDSDYRTMIDMNSINHLSKTHKVFITKFTAEPVVGYFYTDLTCGTPMKFKMRSGVKFEKSTIIDVNNNASEWSNAPDIPIYKSICNQN